MDNLTVIIPFLNEGKEIYNTVENIRRTASESIEIILIDDNSTDAYDYKSVADIFSTKYYKNKERMGVAQSRDFGVKICKTENFILLDGHMRFYTQFWDKIINESLLEPESLVSCQTKRLRIDPNGEVVENSSQPTTYGAYISFNYLSLIWNTFDPNPRQTKIEIPCIIGAAYACTKTYWQFLHGLKFLKEIGFDEQYISLKTMLSGGKCYLLKDLLCGHVYRNKAPYLINQINPVFNRLLIAELLLPESLKYSIYMRSERYMHEEYIIALKMLDEIKNHISEEKDYLQKISKISIDTVIEFNNKYRI
jgi:glycosyltransferase involved in cell wall biosynthesis